MRETSTGQYWRATLPPTHPTLHLLPRG